MALKRPSLGGTDWIDVAMIWTAFETINDVRLVMRTTAVDDRGRGTLALVLVAEERQPEDGDPKVLGSVSVTCSASGFQTFEAVVSQLLYALDAKLASGEFANVIAK